MPPVGSIEPAFEVLVQFDEIDGQANPISSNCLPVWIAFGKCKITFWEQVCEFEWFLNYDKSNGHLADSAHLSDFMLSNSINREGAQGYTANFEANFDPQSEYWVDTHEEFYCEWERMRWWADQFDWRDKVAFTLEHRIHQYRKEFDAAVKTIDEMGVCYG